MWYPVYRLIKFSIETHVRFEVTPSGRKRRSADILDEIDEIEENATSFILDGEMKMPDDVEVVKTFPIETVEFYQKTADGSIAADCSSGSCQCTIGFIDNGNGCEVMTEEQAATTQAPITAQPAQPITEYIQSLVDKMQSVFEDNRPGKPRTKLLKKWQKLSKKFSDRYRKIVNGKGCNFADTYTNDSLDFDSVKTCRVCSDFLQFYYKCFCV